MINMHGSLFSVLLRSQPTSAHGPHCKLKAGKPQKSHTAESAVENQLLLGSFTNSILAPSSNARSY